MTKLFERGLAAIKQLDPKLFDVWRDASVYDFTKVSELVTETSSTLLSKLKSDDNVMAQRANRFFDTGGLLISPCNLMYIEIQDNPCKIGYFVASETTDNGLTRQVFPVFLITSTGYFADTRITLLVEKGDVCYLRDTPKSKLNRKEASYSFAACIVCAAALITLNAPYGIDLEPAPVHKGQAREAKRQNRKLNPVTIIKLSKTVKPERIVSSGRGSPKGFHFVRSHSRLVRYPDTYTTVKAHWRGDPALGIHRANYKVVP